MTGLFERKNSFSEASIVECKPSSREPQQLLTAAWFNLLELTMRALWKNRRVQTNLDLAKGGSVIPLLVSTNRKFRNSVQKIADGLFEFVGVVLSLGQF